MPTRESVLDALSGVRDPELDEPVTDLGFVSDLRIEDGAVRLRLRLPTYFCAPNFAYLMVADARDAVLSVPGVERAVVTLDDHYASEEINGSGDFEEAFGDETEGPDLKKLRETFRRKSFVSRQEQLCRELLSGGLSPAELARMSLADELEVVEGPYGVGAMTKFVSPDLPHEKMKGLKGEGQMEAGSTTWGVGQSEHHGRAEPRGE